LLKRSFGKCPKGHALQSLPAKKGHCDGCGRVVRCGDMVMDCRTCNWYLCSSCHPKGGQSTLWDTISSYLELASLEVSGLANEVAQLVPTMACTSPCKADLSHDEIILEPETVDTKDKASKVTGGTDPVPEESEESEGDKAGPGAAQAQDLLEFDDLLDLSESPAPATASSAVAEAAPAAPAETPAPTEAPVLFDLAPAETPAPAEAPVLFDLQVPAAASPPPVQDLVDLLGDEEPVAVVAPAEAPLAEAPPHAEAPPLAEAPAAAEVAVAVEAPPAVEVVAVAELAPTPAGDEEAAPGKVAVGPPPAAEEDFAALLGLRFPAPADSAASASAAAPSAVFTEDALAAVATQMAPQAQMTDDLLDFQEECHQASVEGGPVLGGLVKQESFVLMQCSQEAVPVGA